MKDYIRKVHKRNWDMKEKTGVEEGDILYNVNTDNKFKVTNIHSKYGWLLTKSVEKDNLIHNGKPCQNWKDINNFKLKNDNGEYDLIDVNFYEVDNMKTDLKEYFEEYFENDLNEYWNKREELIKQKTDISTYEEYVNMVFDYAKFGSEQNKYWQELINGYEESQMDLQQRIGEFRNFLQEKSTFTLRKFIKKEPFKFFDDRQIYRTEWVEDDLKHVFDWDDDDYDIYTSYISSHMGSLHLSTKKSIIVEEYMSSDKGFECKEDYYEILDQIDFRNCLNIFIYEKIFDGYKIDVEEEYEKAKNEVKIELLERIWNIKNENNNIKQKITRLENKKKDLQDETVKVVVKEKIDRLKNKIDKNENEIEKVENMKLEG